jgi:sugar lactone lactonase YvrE
VGVSNAGAYDVVVSNPYGSVTSSVVNLTIQTPLQVTTVSLPIGTNGAAYNQTLTASGGQPPYSWTNISGALPPGLALATNGVISGTPTTNGIFDFTVKVTDTLGGTTTQALALAVPVLSSVTWIQPTNSSVAVAVGSNVTFSVSVAGTGPFSYQWQLNGTNLPNAVITTVAGNGTAGYAGEGGAATNAEFDVPDGVAVDAAGNLFIADYYNNRIRKMGTNGIIRTVAGNGINGYSGDGGAATNAELGYPNGVAVDAKGNLFIADYYNNRIRKVGTNGTITTVAGNGTAGYSGDGGAATSAELRYPSGVAVDAGGNLFVADEENNMIRKIDTNGIIATVAGNGTQGYSGDGGAASEAELFLPYGVALDATGNLFIADLYNQRIRKVGINGIISTVAGNGTNGYAGDGGAATNAELYYPLDVALDATGNLYIADYYNNRIREVGINGIITTAAGNGTYAYSGDGGPATNAELSEPFGVAVDAAGNLLVADTYNERIRKVVFQGLSLALNNVGISNAGAYDVVVSSPYGSVTSSVLNLTIQTPLQVTTVSLPIGTDGVAYNQTLAASGGQPPYSWTNISGALPPGLALATNGVISGTPMTNGTFDFTVKVTDTLGGTATQGLALTVPSLPGVIWVQPTSSSVAVAVGSNVSLAVSAAGTGPFSYQWQLNGTNLPNGIISTVAGDGTEGYSGDGGAATNAELYYPGDVAVDAIGNLFIVDDNNYRIRKMGTNGIITTVAGNGTNGYAGDGGAAINAELSPSGVAVDATGNLYIADFGNYRIRKVGTNGIITTVAGNGGYGYSGDGGAATNAEFIYPYGVAVDAAGNLFIADRGNNRIRKVGTNGVIITVAGNGYFNPSTGAGGYSGDGGAATSAELSFPEGVAVDPIGNLFIADVFNYRIRKVGTNGIITTVAGNGYTNQSGGGGYSGDGGAATNAELYYPVGVAADSTGNLFIADTYNYRIRKVGANGIITTVAGNGGYGYSGDGGAATNAELNEPYSAAVDVTGNLFIADIDNNRTRKVVFHGPTLVLTNVGAANIGAYDVVVSNPYGTVTSSVVSLIIAAPLQVTTVSVSNGTNGAAYNQTLAASGGQSPYIWTNVSGALPPGLALASNGVISGAPTTNGTFDFTVKVTDTLGGTATQALALTVIGLPSVAIQTTNNPVFVTVGSNVTLGVSVTGTGPFSYQWQLNGTNIPSGIITTVAGNGTAGYSGDGGAATNAELYAPLGVAVDAAGNLFIADFYYSRIRKVGTNGIITTVAGGGSSGLGDGGAATNAGLVGPEGVAVDAHGNLFIADRDNQRIRKVGTNGIITTVAGNGTLGYSGDGGTATNAKLADPFDVAVDATGNLFIADYGTSRIRKVDTNGIITTVAGNGSFGNSGDGGAATNAKFNSLTGVAVDATGNLFIADYESERIRMVGANGIISTVAGNGTAGYSGNGGAATNAELYNPKGAGVDATGNLFIADEYNNVVREVRTNGVISTVAGNGYDAGTANGGYSGDGGAATHAELYAPFRVAADAAGNLFIADSGNNVIRKVINQGLAVTGPTLALNDVGFGNAGAYDVVVSSPYGSVTSSVVNLTVTTPPVLSAGGFNTSGGLQLSVYGQTGQAYTLQASTNLVNWVSILNFTCTNSPTYVVDPAAKNFRYRFYRLAQGTLLVPASPVVLGFGSAQPLSSNGLALMLQGPVGSNYVIQASTDLVTWLPVTNFVSTNSPFYFNFPTATNYSHRFYRAVIP